MREVMDPRFRGALRRALPIVNGRARPGHPRLLIGEVTKTWMPGPSPGMTL